MGGSPVAGQAPDGIRPAVLITPAPPPPPPSGPVALGRSPQALFDRLGSFDANRDHRVSRDELPERMQGLIARGDKNADAALDLNEIRALVNAAASERFQVAFRAQQFEGFPGVIRDLKLPSPKREQALALANLPQSARHISDPTDSELYKAMRALLDDEEYANFVAAATRLSRTARIGDIGCGISTSPPKCR